MNNISEDSKAILLLCGHLGGVTDVEPLNQREYNEVVRWLLGRNLRPSDLLVHEHVEALAEDSRMPLTRLDTLMKRGVKLGLAVEQWSQSGIWVICRSDPDYPARYKSHLKDKAPPILFGAGSRDLLVGGGLGIVGSRNVDAEGEEFTRYVAAWCAAGRMPVISGGARGVDQTAMATALEAGGTVIGVLADSLLKRSVSRDARYALADGRLLLISPYHPDAGFNVGNAMGRNKLIYALADYGLVVSADLNKGGTWEGATEELKRSPRRPVFVRMSGSIPKGNSKLMEMGGIAFPVFNNTANAADLLTQAASATAATVRQSESDMPLFEQSKQVRPPSVVREPTHAVEQKATLPPTTDSTPPATIYDAVLPLIITALSTPASAADLAERLDVSKSQIAVWLKRALGEKKVVRRGRPVLYAKGSSASL